MPLPRAFFARDTLVVARELLGQRIVRRRAGAVLVARIVETEAYHGDEPACHAHANLQRVRRGELPRGRSAVLFGEPGTAYVYFNYGMYWLFNVVTEPAGTAGAVLIRAIEPEAGIERMRELRPSAKRDRDLGNGPGKLALALDIGPRFNGHVLTASDELFLAKGPSAVRARDVVAGPRIGISKAQALPWRFHLRGNEFVSG
ncbi:MAG TPA: DNA-3-methyladenine glycosylase [Planctomycetota bacterium]|nr:DNA-3-methyladenine glycosylase [Planctomycetota bacterium]